MMWYIRSGLAVIGLVACYALAQADPACKPGEKLYIANSIL